MFGREDRTAAKWMLGVLPGIKLMNLTAASGHHDTHTAWVVQHGVPEVLREGKKWRKPETMNHENVQIFLPSSCGTFDGCSVFIGDDTGFVSRVVLKRCYTL